MDKKQLDDLAVETFRRYLRIRSVHPNPDYASCVEFLLEQAKLIGLECNVVELVPGKPIVVMRWEGTDPKLSAVMLNSHMDVVPAREDLWEHDPFAAELDEEGRVFGRGSQDMKHLAIMHMEAVHRLKAQGVRLRRTVVITMVPEVKVRCRGFTGHGSIPVPGTPGEKLRVVLDRFMDFRQEELDKLQQDPNLWMADVTSTNLTIVEGGSALNVIPPEMSAVFDLRINPLMDFDKLEEKIWQWCSDAGEGVELEFLAKQDKVPTTLIGADNKWWTAFQKATEKLEMKIKPLILPATSDARFIRRAGIPALGFMPINNTPLLPHGIDEYITAASLLRGIDIFQGVLQEVANVL